MKRKIIFFLIIAITYQLINLSTVFALDLGFAKGDGGRPGAFLQYGAGARSLGMGKTFVGIADDASAVYWNPAGIAQLKQKELVALQNKLYVDTDYSFLAFATPIKIGTIGIGLVNLNSTGFQLRDEYNYELGEGGVNESAALVSFAKKLTINSQPIAIGATAKIVNQNVDSRKDTGYGVDVGLLSNYKKLNFGLALQNIIAPRILLKNKEDIYPLSATLGIGYKALQDKLLLAMDINKTENRSLKFHLGSEYVIANLFALRAGIDETEAALGAGIHWRNYAIDYAFAYHDAWKGYEDLGASHRFGMTVKWGKQKQMADNQYQTSDKTQTARMSVSDTNIEQTVELASAMPQVMDDAQDTVLIPEEKVKQEIKEQLEKQTGEKVSNVEIQKIEEVTPVKSSENILTYIVKQGDCLWNIAAKPEIYGNSWNWKLIYEANKDQIKNPDLIYPGQVLKITR